MKSRDCQQKRRNSNSSSKAIPKERDIWAKSVCFTQQQTTVFEGAPIVSGSAAVLLGDVDNDPRAEIEVAVGGIDGTIAVFKAGHHTTGAYLTASGLGALSTLGLGTLLLGHSDTQQLIACTGEGVCHIFNIRPTDIRWDDESGTGRVEPLWSIPCPRNVTSCCIADIDGDNRQEVVMGTRDGGIHALSLEVTPEGSVEKEQEETETGTAYNRPRQGEGKFSATSPSGENACSDAHSSSSSEGRSRPSTPPMDDLALDQTGEEWLPEEDRPSDALRGVWGRGGKCSTDASELRGEERRRTASPDTVPPPGPTSPGGGKPREGSRRKHLDEQDTLRPLNPHFRSLLELRAGGAVTSLSIVHYPEVVAVPPTCAEGTPCPSAAAAAAAAAAALADGSSDHSGDDDGSPSGLDESGGGDGRYSDDGCSKPRARDGRQASDSKSEAAAAVTEAVEPEPEAEPGPDASAAGVYVAVGLETGAAEVVRLSRWRAGTRLFDLVDTAARLSERRPSAWEAVGSGAAGGGGGGGGRGGDGDDGDNWGGGGGGGGGDGSSASSELKHPGHAGEPPEPLEGCLGGSSPAGEQREGRNSASGAGGGGGGGDGESDDEDGVASLRLDGAKIETEQGVRSAATAAGPAATSAWCGWRVPADVDDGPVAYSSRGWEGPGLVVGLSNPADAAAAAAAAVAAATAYSSTSFAVTPNTPLLNMSAGVRGWGWGRASEVAAGGAEARGGAVEDDEEDRMFAVCTLDGFVRCCRVVSTAGGQPRWRTMWTRRTKEALFSLQRLGYPNRKNSPGHAAGERESLLVGCSWSGSTVIFDAGGMCCAVFDPDPFLSHPLAAFVAGDLTSPSGSTGPSLVYVGSGGEVVVYHGLSEQMGPIDPAQFIPTLHEDGSIDTLQGLVQRLVERLQWRSNQGDPLFPAAYSYQREEISPVRSRNVNSVPTESAPIESAPTKSVAVKPATAEYVANKFTATESAATEYSATESAKPGATESVTAESFAAMAAKGFSDDETDSGLCLPDAILARAILGPPGVAVALASTARENRRRRASEHGGSGGGGGGGGGGIDDERWRREVRALETGEESTITVAEGAAAAERVLKEIEAWDARGRDPTLRSFPCLRGTLAALTRWGSGPRRESLQRALSDSEVCASPPA